MSNRERCRRWRVANRAKHREASRRWQKQNRKKANAKQRRWNASHLERIRDYARLRRARKRGAEGSHTLAEWKWLCVLFGNKCVKCGCDGVTRDHIVALVNGGSDFILNIQPLCGPCNFSKQHLHSTDYRKF